MHYANLDAIQYEQCPFETEHARGIYPNILDFQESETWHPFGVPGQQLYRVHAGYLQAIICEAAAESVLFQELQTLEPMESNDDATWRILRTPAGQYLVSSKFAVAFGPSEGVERFATSMQAHGFQIETEDDHVRMSVKMAKLSPDALLDATKRLKLMEALCVEANRRILQILDQHWGWLCDKFAEEGALDLYLQEYAYKTEGRKRREPLLREGYSPPAENPVSDYPKCSECKYS